MFFGLIICCHSLSENETAQSAQLSTIWPNKCV